MSISARSGKQKFRQEMTVSKFHIAYESHHTNAKEKNLKKASAQKFKNQTELGRFLKHNPIYRSAKKKFAKTFHHGLTYLKMLNIYSPQP